MASLAFKDQGPHQIVKHAYHEPGQRQPEADADHIAPNPDGALEEGRTHLEHHVIHRHRRDKKELQAAHRDHESLQRCLLRVLSPSDDVAPARCCRAGVFCGNRRRAW